MPQWVTPYFLGSLNPMAVLKLLSTHYPTQQATTIVILVVDGMHNLIDPEAGGTQGPGDELMRRTGVAGLDRPRAGQGANARHGACIVEDYSAYGDVSSARPEDEYHARAATNIPPQQNVTYCGGQCEENHGPPCNTTTTDIEHDLIIRGNATSYGTFSRHYSGHAA